MDKPDLFYGLARVQYLAGLPYAEIRDNSCIAISSPRS